MRAMGNDVAGAGWMRAMGNIVVGPGSTLYLSRSIEMELSQKVLKIEAFVGIEGRAGGYGQGSLFEFHPKEERNGKGQ